MLAIEEFIKEAIETLPKLPAEAKTLLDLFPRQQIVENYLGREERRMRFVVGEGEWGEIVHYFKPEGQVSLYWDPRFYGSAVQLSPIVVIEDARYDEMYDMTRLLGFEVAHFNLPETFIQLEQTTPPWYLELDIPKDLIGHIESVVLLPHLPQELEERWAEYLVSEATKAGLSLENILKLAVELQSKT